MPHPQSQPRGSFLPGYGPSLKRRGQTWAALFPLEPRLQLRSVMNVPKIADDVLHCSIFPPIGADAAVLASQISRYVGQWLPNHIWHRDSFQLVLSKDVEGTLECTMRVGDSVDDEWLVVWLLFQISKEFNAVARYVH